jgi:xanthine dehydrogenase accessory factor
MLKEALIALQEVILAGKDAVLVTVIESSGSGPGKKGARMLITDSGRVAGTIGGGAVEFQAEKTAKVCLGQKKSFEESYDLTSKDESLNDKSPYVNGFEHGANAIVDLGMVCGGKMKVGFEYLSNQQPKRLRFYQEELKRLSATAPKVYVFGGGHVAQALIPVLHRLDYACVVVDDRPEFLTKTLFPKAQERIFADMGELKKTITVTKQDYAVVLTRGHLLDFEVAIQSEEMRNMAKRAFSSAFPEL